MIRIEVLVRGKDFFDENLPLARHALPFCPEVFPVLFRRRDGNVYRFQIRHNTPPFGNALIASRWNTFENRTL